MAIEELPIACYYDKQRFAQFSPQDAANWYMTQAPSGKKGLAMYPAMGRRHISVNMQNKLIFPIQPRTIFKSIDFMYVVVGSRVFQVDSSFNEFEIFNADFNTTTADIYFAYLSYSTNTYVMLTDGIHCYVINELTKMMFTITDPKTPKDPTYIAAFGNRFVVSGGNTPFMYLTEINLGGDLFSPTNIFSNAGGPGLTLFAQASGKIQQMCVLHNQLFVFNNFTTDIWMNIPSQIVTFAATTLFPWKLNTSFGFDYGMFEPQSLDVDFGMMVWLAQNRNGLVTFMMSAGQSPEVISTQAINVLLQRASNDNALNPFLSATSNGFLYQYENTIFYRISAGDYHGTGILDEVEDANCIEFNFDTKTWHRCVEVNGERNRIIDHVFFNNKHIVNVLKDPALYAMSGDVYVNEIRNPAQPSPQMPDSFLAYPIRYEAITKIISQDDYSEFKTDDIQIDFVWGEQTFIRYLAPYENTVYIVSETSTPLAPQYAVAEDNQTFIIMDQGNTPGLNDEIYYDLFKPHIELYISDDGGISFYSADVLEFSQLGVYSWRMRWYQCGVSRNRVYKLICVSPSPIVVLGGTMNVERISGGMR